MLCVSDEAIKAAQAEEGAAVVSFVETVPVLASLPAEKLARLVSSMQPRRYPRGAVIFVQGDTPQGLGIVREGRCSVSRMVDLDGRRQRSMRVDSLLPRDTFGGDAILQGALRNYASVTAETDVAMLHLPRHEFSASLLSDEALRLLQLNMKLTKPDDDMLRARYEREAEWRSFKQRYIKAVVSESRDRRLNLHRKSGIPALVPRSRPR